MAPIYLSDLLKYKQNTRSLRSSADTNSLSYGKARLKTIGERAFQIYAPRIWNDIPKEIRQLECITSFKKHLKTFLFGRCYQAP